ncbi:hypothetical protein HDV00_006310 [Rhizophlyctis rosea]|nr:hypothetical protein HDV00_006310 [Rhizophlyctis rosea]
MMYGNATAEDFHRHRLANDLNEWVASYFHRGKGIRQTREEVDCWVITTYEDQIEMPCSYYEELVKAGGIRVVDGEEEIRRAMIELLEDVKREQEGRM